MQRIQLPWPGKWILILTVVVLGWGCGQAEPEPTAIQLVDRFDEATIDNSVEAKADLPRIEWRFDDESAAAEWQVLDGLADVQIQEGRLVGRVTGPATLILPGPESPDPNDFFHAIEVVIQTSEGSRLGLSFESAEDLEPELEEIKEDLADTAFFDFNIDLIPGDESRTYTLTAANAVFQTSLPISAAKHILIRPTDAEGAEFAIESLRLITVREHLASIPSGIGWQGLDDVFRETLVARSPETITFEVDLPSDPFLDVALGTVDAYPITFRIAATVDGEDTQLLQRTLSTPQRWNPEVVDLKQLANRQVALSFSITSDKKGTPGYWGTPVIRNRTSPVSQAASSKARDAVAGAATTPPRGVILIVADTLRRDHLDAYGYERATAPTVKWFAENGVLFQDNISQATWTKVSVSSILTSLYPTTHGIKDMPDRMPAGVHTLAEAYRSAGYATFATSSVPFTGKLTNLHQGVEVLHESSSVPELDHSGSTTSRTYTDRLLEWIDIHQEVPFFAFLHVFDPHSPFEPYAPYESLWLEPEELTAHRQDMETVKEFIEDGFFRYQALPDQEEIEKSGVDIDTYVRREKAWYDASIRAMDLEIGRLLERLQQLGLDEDTLIVLISDHGEEFLEHGQHFHGYHAYGEMLNVPLIMWWPGGLPAGVEVETTVQSIDLMPTLLELSQLPVPENIQGQSLLPLLAGSNPTSLGWKPRPAVAERAYAPAANEGEDNAELESFAVVDGDWKLIWNTNIPDERPEYELFDHKNDPINLFNVADEHPEVVERLADYLKNWHEAALAAKVDTEAAAEEMSTEELEKLRALGYIN